MRSFGKAVVTWLALAMAASLGGAAPAVGQDTAPAANLPKGPVPYTQLRPKPKRPAPRPAATPPAKTTPSAAPAVAAPVAAAAVTATAPKPAAAATAAPAPAAVATPRPTPVALAPAAPAQVTDAPIPPAQLEAWLDGWMADAMAREHIPGAAVSIVQNGQVVLKKGYGYADLATRRPVNPDTTMFRIGSVSKTFTWILVMRDVEAGRMRLDRPINLYLPERVRLTGRARGVTVGNLMDHTPGFEDPSLGQLFENDPRRVRPLNLYLRQERPSQVRPAGQVSSYSNYGVALAGAALAQMSGKTFERRVEDEIATPLHMGHTTFREPRPDRRGLPAPMPQRLRGDLATGYGWRSAGYMPNAYEYIGQVAPAGAGSSTAGDMSRYMLMLLGNGSHDGATVFGPVAAKAFRTPIQKTPTGVNGWAHGFIVFDLPGDHRGYGHLGHTIAFQSNMTVVPDLALGVFVTTNSESGAKLADILPEVLVRRFYAPAGTLPRLGSAELAQAGGGAFEGDYISTRRAFGGLEGFVNLLAVQAKVGATSGGRLLVDRNGEVQAYVPEGPLDEGRFIGVTDDRRLRFHMQDGRAASLQLGLNAETLERTPFTQQIRTLIAGVALTGFASVATLLGLAVRNRRELRQNAMQVRASLVQTMQAGLWLTAFIFFGLWGAGTSDAQGLMYGWPGPLIVTASACALVAAALTLLTIAALPAVWQGGRRVESWTTVRKLFFTATVLIYSGFSLLLALNGGLEPWSG